jgi:hypothetical protein
VTEDGVKPFIKPEQNTLILRDISTTTPPDLIKNVFTSSNNCPEIVSIRSDMNDTW